jgi:hypothetical protein
MASGLIATVFIGGCGANANNIATPAWVSPEYSRVSGSDIKSIIDEYVIVLSPKIPRDVIFKRKKNYYRFIGKNRAPFESEVFLIGNAICKDMRKEHCILIFSKRNKYFYTESNSNTKEIYPVILSKIIN